MHLFGAWLGLAAAVLVQASSGDVRPAGADRIDPVQAAAAGGGVQRVHVNQHSAHIALGHPLGWQLGVPRQP